MNNIKSNPRKRYSAAFKAPLTLEALKETETIAQIASDRLLHPNLFHPNFVTKWKQEAVAELPVYWLEQYERPY